MRIRVGVNGRAEVVPWTGREWSIGSRDSGRNVYRRLCDRADMHNGGLNSMISTNFKLVIK